MRSAIVLFCLALSVFSELAHGRYVVGGTNANIADHPHQLSLQVSGSHNCGASLISTNKAVTAAHCGGGAIATYSILAGATVRTDSTCTTCVTASLNSFIRHPDFVNVGLRGYPNDVATLHFNDITLNSNVRPITMATSNAGDFTGQNCVITGWGRTQGSNPILPNILQQGIMEVISNAACIDHWGALAVNDGHVCILSATVSACSADSGGPLVCGSTLIGATSWGDGGCDPGKPSVYARISYFRDWIDTN